MRDESSKKTGPTFRDSPTLRISLPESEGRVITSELISFVEETLAKKTAPPELPQERERRLSALNSSRLLQSFARALFSARIQRECERMPLIRGGDSETDLNPLVTESSLSGSVLVALGLTISGTGCSCSLKMPTPTASLFGCKDVAKVIARRERCKKKHKNGNGFGLTLGQWCAINNVELTPEMAEQMMGFPAGWTDCDSLETPQTHE